jgi:succinate dehydrogenase / fumarate reductase flavoprotein subunit
VLTHTLVNPQVNRQLTADGTPSEDVALHVVKETDAGLIVQGARLWATLGPLSDEIAVFPSTVLNAAPASSGLFVAPGIQKLLSSLKESAADAKFERLMTAARDAKRDEHNKMLGRAGGNENPYLIHQELGDVMTRAATVVRRNDQLADAYATVCKLEERVRRCSLSDTGQWTNQNVVFTKAVRDMFPIAKAILKGAQARDECRGAHYKPDFDMPGITATDPAERRRDAEKWCDAFEAKNKKWLKTTIATFNGNGDNRPTEPQLTYEDVDTSLIPPRPRLYGLVGAEVIEEVWKSRQAK